MKKKVKQAIEHFNMLESGDKVIVALSGGADSVSLLFALRELSDELGITLSACHVNHGLRGEESDADCRFVQELCERLNVPLELLETDVRAFRKKHESLEECARRVRYDFFDRISNGKKLATAHTASDNAETVMLNLIRGTALKGLCGIPPVRGNIIRPLIFCSREEIEQYCKDNSLSYVTDKTNFSLDYTRNKVRHNIIPLLREINPALYESFKRMNISLYDDNAYFEKIVNAEKSRASDGANYRVELLQPLDDVILKRIVYSVLVDEKIEPTTLRINGITEIIRLGKGKINLEMNRFAVVKKGIFHIEFSEQIYKHKINR